MRLAYSHRKEQLAKRTIKKRAVSRLRRARLRPKQPTASRAVRAAMRVWKAEQDKVDKEFVREMAVLLADYYRKPEVKRFFKTLPKFADDDDEFRYFFEDPPRVKKKKRL